MDTVRVIINRPKIHKEIFGVGNLWHYGHFIHDFIMPMIHYMNENNVTWKTVYLITNLMRDKLGTFKPLAEKILNLEIIEADELTEELPTFTITHYSFGPYKPVIFNHIIPHVQKTLNIPESSHKIILIERGLSKLLDNQKDNGKNRRSLPNHTILKNRLSNTFGDSFRNIILENLSIEEQISVFMNAQIVIGQHGGGLCNIIWMANPDSLVIEFPPHIVNTFKNICLVKNFKYIRSDPNPTRVLEICKNRMPSLWPEDK